MAIFELFCWVPHFIKPRINHVQGSAISFYNQWRSWRETKRNAPSPLPSSEKPPNVAYSRDYRNILWWMNIVQPWSYRFLRIFLLFILCTCLFSFDWHKSTHNILVYLRILLTALEGWVSAETVCMMISWFEKHPSPTVPAGFWWLLLLFCCFEQGHSLACLTCLCMEETSEHLRANQTLTRDPPSNLQGRPVQSECARHWQQSVNPGWGSVLMHGWVHPWGLPCPALSLKQMKEEHLNVSHKAFSILFLF